MSTPELQLSTLYAAVLPDDYEPLVVSAARSWLINEGYKRAKHPLSVYGVPG